MKDVYNRESVEAMVRMVRDFTVDEQPADIVLACCIVITSLVHSLPAKRHDLGWKYVNDILESLKQTQTQNGDVK